jgi:hypothetical protein
MAVVKPFAAPQSIHVCGDPPVLTPDRIIYSDYPKSQALTLIATT